MPTKEAKPLEFVPQTGFQEKFLSSPADIVIGGAAAGVGKTWALVAAPLRHKDVPLFNCIIFRRKTTQVRSPGGLWDKSLEVYPHFGFNPSEQMLEWYNKEKRITIKFDHLQHESDIYNHDGPEYCLIGFDELQRFTKKQFFYLLTRNRSTCGVRPYVLATCNPDPDSFLAEFVEWWIDQDEKLPDGRPNPRWGLVIPERDGILRYFVVHDEKYFWGNSKQEIIDKYPEIFQKYPSSKPRDLIKSVTLISGKLKDNKKLLEVDPGYVANLMSQDESERARLMDGNWKIRSNENCIFDSQAVENLFNNHLSGNTTKRYITCDAARFGKDLCTIFVWYGWRVVKLIILTTSDQAEIFTRIEQERQRFSIPKNNICVDQDGVGDGVVKMGRYVGFGGGLTPMEDPTTHIRENYENRKTQFYYRLAERVNNDEVSIILSQSNVIVDNYFGSKIKIDGKIFDIKDLIKQDLRAIRRRDEEEDKKKKINTKAEQKLLLNGRSPDFSDGMIPRIHFEMKGTGEVRVGTPTKMRESVLDRFV